jgi:hypothetical protein
VKSNPTLQSIRAKDLGNVWILDDIARFFTPGKYELQSSTSGEKRTRFIKHEDDALAAFLIPMRGWTAPFRRME